MPPSTGFQPFPEDLMRTITSFCGVQFQLVSGRAFKGFLYLYSSCPCPSPTKSLVNFFPPFSSLHLMLFVMLAYSTWASDKVERGGWCRCANAVILLFCHWVNALFTMLNVENPAVLFDPYSPVKQQHMLSDFMNQDYIISWTDWCFPAFPFKWQRNEVKQMRKRNA